MNLFSRYPELTAQKDNIAAAIDAIVSCYRAGGKIMLAGNGGSSADCAHITGELVKSFMLPRPLPDNIAKRITELSDGSESVAKLQEGIAAIDLTAQSAVLSAFANDVEAKNVYAQLLYVYARPDDIFLGISTSGNSENIVRAFITAKALGVKSIAFTGAKMGRCTSLADIAIIAPVLETYLVQEYHLPIYHYVCAECEQIIFGNGKRKQDERI